jgi:AraC-like DNA-binding protein
LGSRNAIVSGTAKQYHVADFPGPLSIKTVLRGSALWSTSEADRVVDEDSYLVLNSGQTYTLSIDSRQPVETFCLFFRQGIVEDVFRVERSDPACLLDNPFVVENHSDENADGASTRSSAISTEDFTYPQRQARSRVEFFETLHRHDSLVSPLIRQIYARWKDKTASDSWLEDHFLSIAAALTRAHGEAGTHAARVPAKKYATRIEIYRRLLRGKDYMDSFPGERVHLQAIASEACLSPYHFHRLFREVFHETPNRYRQRTRLAKAKRLLELGEQSVTDICLEVGFESVTSFSALFRRNFGCSPREHRSRSVSLRGNR